MAKESSVLLWHGVEFMTEVIVNWSNSEAISSLARVYRAFSKLCNLNVIVPLC